MQDGDDEFDFVLEGPKAWSWLWRSPSGTTVVSPTTYACRKVALREGRRYVIQQRKQHV
jgi:hypothetical protein